MIANKSSMLFWLLVLWVFGQHNGRPDSYSSHFRVPFAEQFPLLTINSFTNGQARLKLNCEPGISCFIEASSDLINWTAVATNSDNSSNRTINLSSSLTNLFYRAWRKPIPLFAFALAARSNINFFGNGLITDSWNSHDPAQSANGLYNGYAGTNGNIASISGLIDIGNKTINGNVVLGDLASYSSGPSGSTSGLIYSGPESFPDVSLPTVDANGKTIVWNPAPGGSSTHTFTNSGYFKITDSSGIIVQPGITVILDLKVSNFSPSSINIQGGTTNAATVIMYQESGGFSLSGNSAGGAVNNRPENFIYFGLSGVTAISFSGSNPLFTGAIYAPSAKVTFGGGSSLGTSFIGSGVFNDVSVIGHYVFHLDENFLTSSAYR